MSGIKSFAKSTIAMSLLAAASAHAQTVLYSAIPAALPGNVSSLGFEATATREFGDRVQLLQPPYTRVVVPPVAGTVLVSKVTVVMSSWGCQTGGGFTHNCLTTPGATFNHPITLNLYQDGIAGSLLPGALIQSKTQTFAIPYRPSTSPGCAGGGWMQTASDSRSLAPSGTCYNGYATKITFNFATPVTLPRTVIWGISYNTTHYGPNPIGESTPCYQAGSCGYDSLNVGAASFNPTVGVDLDPNGAYWNTAYAPFYCDGGTGGAGTFRLDDSASACWTGYRPMIEFAQ